MKWLGYAWDFAAWFFILSVASASLIGIVRKARARGRRLFRDQPLERLGPRPVRTSEIDHRWDAMQIRAVGYLLTEFLWSLVHRVLDPHATWDHTEDRTTPTAFAEYMAKKEEKGGG